MRHRQKKLKLDRNARQRRPLLRNLAISLITHEKIITTKAKGLAARSFVERMITVGKKNTLAGRRLMIQKLANPEAANKIQTVLGERYKTRQGGYTRVTKLSVRSGDAAERVMVELIV